MSDDEITPPVGIRIKESPHGRGVYADQDFAAGETIEICPTLELDDSATGGLPRDYVLRSNLDPDNSVLMLGYGSLYNHSYEPSAEYVQHTDYSLEFVATRDIAAGEEITIDYGKEWWESRELEPG